jgi:hypothetical protein
MDLLELLLLLEEMLQHLREIRRKLAELEYEKEKLKEMIAEKFQ